jgi:serine/threonine-protein kinase ULK/ATG1
MGCLPLNDCIRVGEYKYREQDILGEGYSSKVYKGTSIHKFDEKYAIKVIDIKKTTPENLALIAGEIELHRSLSHPNIVKFYEAYKT